MIDVFCIGFVIDEYIIKEHQDEFSQVRLEYGTHEILEGTGALVSPKGTTTYS
jgi:hypothetical protein